MYIIGYNDFDIFCESEESEHFDGCKIWILRHIYTRRFSFFQAVSCVLDADFKSVWKTFLQTFSPDSVFFNTQIE